MDDTEKEGEIARIRARLTSLEDERLRLEGKLSELQRQPAQFAFFDGRALSANQPALTAASATFDKVALFRRLFVGRSDVFPIRWDNRKTGKAGYAPACANEWVKGVCGKPQVKCGECPHQAFIPVSDEMIERHLRGGDNRRPSANDFVAGVYPLLLDETCWFLAADFDKETWAADASAMIDTCIAKGIPARPRTVPIRKWRPRLDILLRADPARTARAAWRCDHNGDDGAPPRDWLRVI